MVGARLTFSALAIAPLLASVSAHAADYYQPPPVSATADHHPAARAGIRRQLVFARADRHRHDGRLQAQRIAHSGRAARSLLTVDQRFAAFIGAGVGYEWNNWLRFDVTAGVSLQDAISQPWAHWQLWWRLRPRICRQFRRQHEIVGLPCQRLRRSRYLGLLHAVRRRRHWRRAKYDDGFHRRQSGHSGRWQQFVRRWP